MPRQSICAHPSERAAVLCSGLLDLPGQEGLCEDAPYLHLQQCPTEGKDGPNLCSQVWGSALRHQHGSAKTTWHVRREPQCQPGLPGEWQRHGSAKQHRPRGQPTPPCPTRDIPNQASCNCCCGLLLLSQQRRVCHQ